MSFVIGAIYKNGEVYITADTKANSSLKLFQYPDIKKVFKINDTSLIGVAGDYCFAKAVVDGMNPVITNKQDLLLSLALSLSEQDQLWKRKYNKQFDAAFILGGQMQEQAYLILVIFHQGKLTMYDEPLVAGDYQYFLANPNDLQYELCQDLCEKILLDSKYEEPDQRLERIVWNVAQYSQLVNEKPTTQKVLCQ